MKVKSTEVNASNPYIQYMELRQIVFSKEIQEANLEKLLHLKEKLTQLQPEFHMYLSQVMSFNGSIAMNYDFNRTIEEIEGLILKASNLEVSIQGIPGYAPHQISITNTMYTPMPQAPNSPMTQSIGNFYNGFNPMLHDIQTGKPVQPNFNNVTNNKSILKEVNKIKEATELVVPTDKDIEELYNIYYSILQLDINDNDLGYTGEKLTLPYLFERHINPKFVYHLFGSIYNHKQKPDEFTYMFMKKFYTLLVKDLYKRLLEFENMLMQCDCSSVVPEHILEQLKEMDKRL